VTFSSANAKPNQKIFFSMSTRRLAESVECWNISLALAAGDSWPKNCEPIYWNWLARSLNAIQWKNTNMTDLLVTTNDKFNSCYSGLTVTLVYFQAVEIAKAQQIILFSFFQEGMASSVSFWLCCCCKVKVYACH